MGFRSIDFLNKAPDVDLANRVVKGVVFVTRHIAQDGGIVLPAGLRTDLFEKAGEVLARHGRSTEAAPQNIGRALALKLSDREGVIDVQFADTQLGRDYGYLYGLNEKREVYARGWSFGWNDIEVESWGLARAAKELGEDFDPELLPDEVAKKRSVWVVTKGLLREVSATPNRADLHALTKAAGEGIREAVTLAQALNLEEAAATIASLKREQEKDRIRIDQLERDLKALRGEEASAAAVRNAEALARELGSLLSEIKHKG